METPGEIIGNAGSHQGWSPQFMNERMYSGGHHVWGKGVWVKKIRGVRRDTPLGGYKKRGAETIAVMFHNMT